MERNTCAVSSSFGIYIDQTVALMCVFLYQFDRLMCKYFSNVFCCFLFFVFFVVVVYFCMCVFKKKNVAYFPQRK